MVYTEVERKRWYDNLNSALSAALQDPENIGRVKTLCSLMFNVLFTANEEGEENSTDPYIRNPLFDEWQEWHSEQLESIRKVLGPFARVNVKECPFLAMDTNPVADIAGGLRVRNPRPYPEARMDQFDTAFDFGCGQTVMDKLFKDSDFLRLAGLEESKTEKRISSKENKPGTGVNMQEYSKSFTIVKLCEYFNIAETTLRRFISSQENNDTGAIIKIAHGKYIVKNCQKLNLERRFSSK